MAKHLVAEKLGPTFGQGGDVTVVVEERQGAMALWREGGLCTW